MFNFIVEMDEKINEEELPGARFPLTQQAAPDGARFLQHQPP